MSAKYERSQAKHEPDQAKDAATMWEALSRDMDPTVDGR
jgi:hypothetical protein